jgi:hypothetical protein
MGISHEMSNPARQNGPTDGTGDRPGVDTGSRVVDRHGALDAEAAAVFVQAQATWLCRGLERADDPAAVRLVLSRQEAGHEPWLALIAAAQRRDADLGRRIAGLYAFHGRVAGSLERGTDLRLDPHVFARLRSLLCHGLRRLTDETVSVLGNLGAAGTTFGA